MRRDLEWTEKSNEENLGYKVRVRFFGGKFKFQFLEKGSSHWVYDRVPSEKDLEELVTTLERYYTRARATLKELKIGRALLVKSRNGMSIRKDLG